MKESSRPNEVLPSSLGKKKIKTNTTRTEPKYTDISKSRIIQTKGVKRDVLGVKR